MKTYGHELILDLENCCPARFNRESLTDFFTQLCELIDMDKGDLYFWDDVGVPKEECQTDPRTKGTSAVQFILTSSIVIHTLDILKTVYVNLFSCDEFDADEATRFIRIWFSGDIVKRTEVNRI